MPRVRGRPELGRVDKIQELPRGMVRVNVPGRFIDVKKKDLYGKK
jgi:hypothetical protein